MNRAIAILGALGAGAALMFLMDPDRGRRRRALIRDKAVGLGNDVRQKVSGTATDLRNRAKGMLHEAKSVANEATENLETNEPRQYPA